MFRQLLTSNLRQRAFTGIQQRLPTRNFTTAAASDAENILAKEVEPVTQEKLAPESVVSELEAALEKVNANLAAEKPVVTPSNTTAAVDETIKAAENQIKQEVQAAANNTTVAAAPQQHQPLTEFNELPSFIKHQLEAAKTAPGGHRRFFMQESRTGPDGQGLTTTYRGTFSPEKGLEIHHTNAHHDPTMAKPQITTRVFKTEPVAPQLEQQAAAGDAAAIANRKDSAISKLEDKGFESELDHFHSEFGNLLGHFGRRPFFSRRHDDFFGDMFADDFFNSFGRQQARRLKQLERLQHENKLLAEQNQKLKEKIGQKEVEAAPNTKPTKAQREEEYDDFDFLDDFFSTPFSRSFFDHGSRRAQQALKAPSKAAAQQAQQGAAAAAEQKVAAQAAPQQPVEQVVNKVQQEAVTAQAPAAAAAPVPPAAAAAPTQNAVAQQQVNHPRAYYNPVDGIAPEGFSQWAHNLHRDMHLFNQRINQLEQLGRDPKRLAKALRRRRDPFEDEFSHHLASPLFSSPFHGFGGFGAPRGFFF